MASKTTIWGAKPITLAHATQRDTHREATINASSRHKYLLFSDYAVHGGDMGIWSAKSITRRHPKRRDTNRGKMINAPPRHGFFFVEFPFFPVLTAGAEIALMHQNSDAVTI